MIHHSFDIERINAGRRKPFEGCGSSTVLRYSFTSCPPLVPVGTAHHQRDLGVDPACVTDTLIVNRQVEECHTHWTFCFGAVEVYRLQVYQYSFTSVCVNHRLVNVLFDTTTPVLPPLVRGLLGVL